MYFYRFVFLAVLLLLSSLFCFAQTRKPADTSLKPNDQAIKNSPAFAEILLRKVEIETGLEDLLETFTEEYPKVKEMRFQLGVADKIMERIMAVNPSEAGKLSSALGKLLIRKIELETDLWHLQKEYNDEHPQIKRAKRKLAVFDKAVREILP